MTYKIRVLHCIETIASGGVEQVRLTLVKGLPKDQFEHKIICTWKGGAIAEALEEEGVQLIPIGSFRHPFEWKKHRRVIQIIREYQPHIIHGAIFEGMSMAAISGYWAGVPVRILEETSEPITRSPKAIWLQRFFLRLSDVIIGISPSVVEFLLDKARLPGQKVRLINNGIVVPPKNLSAENWDLRRSLGFAEADFVVGAVGRVFDQVKRFSDIIRALQLIRNPSVKLLIVGDGPDLAGLRALVSSLGLESRVSLVGQQANPHPYYGVMDVFCIPSAHEGFGLVAVEAMMHGLPVLATSVGGLKDVVVDGETGFLVPSHSPPLLTEKIRFLMDHPEVAKQMGAKGNARAMANYSAEQYCKEVQSLYSELLRKKGTLECS
ncbi:glycosyltransferase [Algoriphagus terrigena]|uniref:glycosyltransferase n=1 Tax=Algoriphagus terrigena TaxID=344884 RepID=UPI000404E6EF|nr:glycosyltransferase [Algoriphagus terrigena]